MKAELKMIFLKNSELTIKILNHIKETKDVSLIDNLIDLQEQQIDVTINL